MRRYRHEIDNVRAHLRSLWAVIGLEALIIAALAAVMLFTPARQYLDKGETKAAVIQLKNALQEDPSDVQARLMLGNDMDRLLRVFLHGDAPLEVLDAEATPGPGETVGGEHMVGAAAVVTERLRCPGADEDAAGGLDLIDELLGPIDSIHPRHHARLFGACRCVSAGTELTTLPARATRDWARPQRPQSGTLPHGPWEPTAPNSPYGRVRFVESSLPDKAAPPKGGGPARGEA